MAAQAGLLFYQPTKTVMQLQDAHRNRAFCRLVFLFVVRLSRCEPLAGGLEIFNGFICRTSRDLSLVWRAFFSRRDLGRARTGGTMPAAWWGMAQLYLRHSRSRTHGSTCYEISAKFANEKTPGHCPGFCFDRRNASAYELRVALVMRFALLPKRTSASACVVHLTSQLDQGHHRTATQLQGLAFRRQHRCQMVSPQDRSRPRCRLSSSTARIVVVAMSA